MSSHAIVHDVGELRQRLRASRTVCGCRRPAAAYLERRSMKCSMRPSRAARTSRHVHLRLLSTSASRGWRVRRVRRLAAREPAHSTELHLSRRLAAARKSSAVLCVPGGEQLVLCTSTRGAAHLRVDLCRPSRGECEAGWSSKESERRSRVASLSSFVRQARASGARWVAQVHGTSFTSHVSHTPVSYRPRRSVGVG